MKEGIKHGPCREDDRYMIVLQGRQWLSLTLEVQIKGSWELKEGRGHSDMGSESGESRRA